MTKKTMKIEESTHLRLLNIGCKGQTFDTVINNLIDEVETHVQTNYTN